MPLPRDPKQYEELERLRTAWSEAALQDAYAQARATKFAFTRRALLRHTLLVGATGSGKTNHAYHIIREAMSGSAPGEREASCLVIDVKKEYRRLAKVLKGEVKVLAVGDDPPVRFNPLSPPPGVPDDLWDRAFADVFTRAYGLSEPSRRILHDSLAALREGTEEQPTPRELELQVAKFESGSPREQSSRRSLESRLHLINDGPMGRSLNTEQALDIPRVRGTTVFEIGRVDSLHDQRFLAEVLLMQLWQYDKAHATDEEEAMRRLIVVEEAHRYLSEERPPAQRGDRTLLELAIAEARRYGWAFVIIDQMPLLLSRYVWDNAGTVLAHRLANMESLAVVKSALGDMPVLKDEDVRDPLALRLPENLALFKRYVDPTVGGPALGVVAVSKVG
jgi:hypothetical protein